MALWPNTSICQEILAGDHEQFVPNVQRALDNDPPMPSSSRVRRPSVSWSSTAAGLLSASSCATHPPPTISSCDWRISNRKRPAQLGHFGAAVRERFAAPVDLGGAVLFCRRLGSGDLRKSPQVERHEPWPSKKSIGFSQAADKRLLIVAISAAVHGGRGGASNCALCGWSYSAKDSCSWI